MLPESYAGILSSELLYPVSTALMVVYGLAVWYFNIFKNYEEATDSLINVYVKSILFLYTPALVLFIVNKQYDGILDWFFTWWSIDWYKYPTFGVFGLILVLQTSDATFSNLISAVDWEIYVGFALVAAQALAIINYPEEVDYTYMIRGEDGVDNCFNR